MRQRDYFRLDCKSIFIVYYYSTSNIKNHMDLTVNRMRKGNACLILFGSRQYSFRLRIKIFFMGKWRYQPRPCFFALQIDSSGL